jgi:hypothetical protein
MFVPSRHAAHLMAPADAQAHALIREAAPAARADPIAV